MLLTEKQNINIKNNYLLAITLIAIGILGLFINHPAQASNSSVSAQICQGGQTNPAIISTTPNNNSTVFTNNGNLNITTNWGKKISVRLNGIQIFEQNINYQANNTILVPYTNLNQLPQLNNFEISLIGGCPESSISQNINLNYNSQLLTFKSLNTNSRSPRLYGEINNHSLGVRVLIGTNPTPYIATNNSDGTWSLPSGTIPDLIDGEYDIVVESYDLITLVASQTVTIPRGLIIDTVAPTGTFNGGSNGDSHGGNGSGVFNGGTFDDRSPGFSGTTDDPTAKISININGETYIAINNGNGTWSLPANLIRSLSNGEYDIEIIFSDQAGNTHTINGLIKINAPNQIGFLIPPNSGYLRIGHINIPSWAIYLILIGIIGSIIITKHKKANS